MNSLSPYQSGSRAVMEEMGNAVHSARAPWAVRTIFGIVGDFGSGWKLLVANLPKNIGHFPRAVLMPDFWPREGVKKGGRVIGGERSCWREA